MYQTSACVDRPLVGVMPEGHAIHRLAQQLNELRSLRMHAESPRGRFAAGAQRICGAVLQHARAHGKHLILQVSPENTYTYTSACVANGSGPWTPAHRRSPRCGCGWPPMRSPGT
jgi:hypothetical protein